MKRVRLPNSFAVQRPSKRFGAGSFYTLSAKGSNKKARRAHFLDLMPQAVYDYYDAE